MARQPLEPRQFDIQPKGFHHSRLPLAAAAKLLMSVLRRACAALCLLLAGGFPAPAAAGLGSADVVVVVNGQSLSSRTLANHYVALRGIPARNIIVLDQVPSSETISVDDFREKILGPLLREAERRRLLKHIQCVAYSADFPTAIDISKDLKPVEPLHKLFTKQASINALTYFYTQVLNSNPGYIDLHANFYARREFERYFSNPGGSLTEASWKEIQAHMNSGEHAQALALLLKLLEDHPHQFPLAYLAATQAAQAGDNAQALELLKLAISKGWNSANFVAQDSRLESLRDDAQFQILELLLDESIKELQPASGFDARQAWTPNGVPTPRPQFGIRYLLSTVLGVTRGAGTSLPEAISALKRSAAADFTHPQGGFYFCLTNDVRTTTRGWGFIAAVDELQQLGFEAVIVKSALPRNKPRVLGAQLGAANFDWSSSGSTFLPGALAENLTSLGGVMSPGAGQTNLSALIRAGAAGSSGAVTEPYALQEKFPHPQMYLHYARGASLAEAFYLSVTGPYQLLIVGDPLCRPFSHAPQSQMDCSLREIEEGQVLNFSLDMGGRAYVDWLSDDSQSVASRSDLLKPTAVRILFDGADPMAGAAAAEMKVRVSEKPPGYHELNMQFYADDPLMQCSSVTVPIWIGPSDAITTELPAGLRHVQTGEYDCDYRISLQDKELRVSITANSPQVNQVSLWHDAEKLDEAEGAHAEFIIPLESLGMGPVRLQAQAQLASGETITDQPLRVDVQP